MPRRLRLVIMLVVTCCLVAAIIATVPFRIEEEYINRKTGELSSMKVLCLVSRSDSSVRPVENIAKYGSLTAPDEQLLISRRVYPFPWSRTEMREHWYTHTDLNHYALKLLFIFSFSMPKACRPLADKPQMSDERFGALMQERLEKWNTISIDDKLESVAEDIRKENEKLFPGEYLLGTNDRFTITIPSAK